MKKIIQNKNDIILYIKRGDTINENKEIETKTERNNITINNYKN